MAATDSRPENGAPDEEELNALVATMTDPRRSRIVHALAVRPGMGAVEISKWTDLPATTVRRQLRTLMALGMVEVKEREVRRGVQKLYFVRGRLPWVTEEHEAKLSRRQLRTIDLEILRLIVGDARKAIASPVYAARRGRWVATVQGTVDARAWQEISDLQAELVDRMVEIVDAGSRRLGESDEEPVTLTAALLLLELPEPADMAHGESSAAAGTAPTA